LVSKAKVLFFGFRFASVVIFFILGTVPETRARQIKSASTFTPLMNARADVAIDGIGEFANVYLHRLMRNSNMNIHPIVAPVPMHSRVHRVGIVNLHFLVYIGECSRLIIPRGASLLSDSGNLPS
jgi:hypothetical protein